MVTVRGSQYILGTTNTGDGFAGGMMMIYGTICEGGRPPSPTSRGGGFLCTLLTFGRSGRAGRSGMVSAGTLPNGSSPALKEAHAAWLFRIFSLGSEVIKISLPHAAKESDGGFSADAADPSCAIRSPQNRPSSIHLTVYTSDDKLP